MDEVQQATTVWVPKVGFELQQWGDQSGDHALWLFLPLDHKQPFAEGTLRRKSCGYTGQ
jgi:hypothetical protein